MSVWVWFEICSLNGLPVSQKDLIQTLSDISWLMSLFCISIHSSVNPNEINKHDMMSVALSKIRVCQAKLWILEQLIPFLTGAFSQNLR